MGGEAWAPVSPLGRYNLNLGPATNTPTELTSISSPGEGAAKTAALLSPENPLFVFGVLGALTFGLMAFSTSVRVGHTTASVGVGSTK